MEIIESPKSFAAPASAIPTKTWTAPPDFSSYHYATFWQRFLASLLDSFILGAVNTLIGLVFGILSLVLTFLFNGFSMFTTDPSSFNNNSPSGNNVILLIIDLILGLTRVITVLGVNGFYYLYFLTKDNATPGKKALGIRIVTVNGESLTPGRIILREFLGKFVSSLFLFLGYLWVLWDEKKQAWHDKIANTIVVKI